MGMSHFHSCMHASLHPQDKTDLATHILKILTHTPLYVVCIMVTNEVLILPLLLIYSALPRNER